MESNGGKSTKPRYTGNDRMIDYLPVYTWLRFPGQKMPPARPAGGEDFNTTLHITNVWYEVGWIKDRGRIHLYYQQQIGNAPTGSHVRRIL